MDDLPANDPMTMLWAEAETPRAGSPEAQIAVLLHEAKTRPDAAAMLLDLAATYLRKCEPLPVALAEHLANALHRAAQASGPERGDVLAKELMVKQSANAPIKGREFDVFLLIAKHDARAASLPKGKRPQAKELVSEVMVTLDVGERTAKQRIAEARAALVKRP